MLVALISETPDISQGDLYRLAGALEINGQHCAEAWGVIAPAVAVIDKRSKLPAGCHPIVFMDRDSDPGALAVHYWDPIQRGPAARVLVQKASGFNTGRKSVAESASHELVELMVDPRVNLWMDHPDPAQPTGVEMALEIADMVQTYYYIEARGDKWRMANFVHPGYFRQDLAEKPERLGAFLASGQRLDHRGELKRPGEIGPEGYAILRRPKGSGWETFAVGAGGKAIGIAEDKAHPWARTRMRGVVA